VKLVNLDYFDETLYPPPPLPFAADKNSVPVATSFFKNLEDGLVGAVATLPDVAEGAVATLRSLELTVDDLQKERLPERASKVLGQASSAISELQRILKDVDQKRLPTRLAAGPRHPHEDHREARPDPRQARRRPGPRLQHAARRRSRRGRR
jgi:hypothetical protein